MKTAVVSKEIFVKEIIIDQTASKIVGLVCFVILTALGAFVRIPLPFTPVPITLQTFFVLLAGAVLGRRWGMASQFGYVLLGTIGLPIFAGAASGLAVLFGPTGGYLVGFIVASWLVGYIISQDKKVSLKQIFLAMFLGLTVIFILGCIWLGILLNLSLHRTLLLGLWPFLPGAIIKLVITSLLYFKIQKRTKQIFGI